MQKGDLKGLTLALLAERTAEATICPSEVARAAAAERGSTDWRGEMAAVHVAVGKLAEEGRVRLSWKGKPRAIGDGPYRIGLLSEAARGG